jgi:hypothetical protein
MADSLTALEAQLVARLQSRLPQTGAGKVHVLTAAELANLSESTQPSPAVHIVYQGYAVAESRPDARASRLTQTWLAVIAVRNLASGKTGSAARADAGQLAGTVAAALIGWTPAPAMRPLQLATPPAAGYSAGYMYLPIAVTTDVLVQQE